MASVALRAKDLERNMYRIGSIIEYELRGDGTIRTVLVQDKDDDIKNGRPGFDGLLLPENKGRQVWGYDYQITKIIKY